MENYRKYEVWDDYWCFEPINEEPLNLLKTLNYFCWKQRENDKVKIRIESYDNTELPSENQVKAFEFVKQNEFEILEGIWKYYKDLVLPIYQSATGIENDEIVNNKSDLSKVFGVKAIEITPFNSNDSVYFLIEFDFKYDCEHGLYLMFKNENPIDLFGEGDKDYESIDIYEKGLYNNDKTALRINICALSGESILTGEYYYDKQIDFKLSKGAYRVFYTINKSNRCRNFIVTDDLEDFTLEYVLKNCE